MRIINHNLSPTYSSTDTSPMSVASQLWQPPSQELHRRFKLPLFIYDPQSWEAAFGITPMAQGHLSRREPILKYINFQLSPTHYQVLWGYSKIGMVSHPNPTISFYKSHRVIQRSYSPSKLSIECSIILRFSSQLTQVFPSRVIKFSFSTSN